MKRILFGCLIATVAVAGPTLGLAGENELTAQEKAAGWKLLFNGKDYAGWKCNNDKPIATGVEQDAMVPYKSGGYVIIHKKPFGDFVLKCDVKWDSPKCNSGIFLRVEDPGNPVHTGFEIQVAGGNSIGKHAMGALYDLVGTTQNASRPMGEWNQVEIRCQGPKISVTINGRNVVQADCDQFDQPGLCPDGRKHKYKLNGKPRAVKDFARSGYLGFQDHGHKVWYRNVKLLELN